VTTNLNSEGRDRKSVCFIKVHIKTKLSYFNWTMLRMLEFLSMKMQFFPEHFRASGHPSHTHPHPRPKK